MEELRVGGKSFVFLALSLPPPNQQWGGRNILERRDEAFASKKYWEVNMINIRKAKRIDLKVVYKSWAKSVRCNLDNHGSVSEGGGEWRKRFKVLWKSVVWQLFYSLSFFCHFSSHSHSKFQHVPVIHIWWRATEALGTGNGKLFTFPLLNV